MTDPGNFNFLVEHSPLLAQLGRVAEQVFAADPNTTLIKLRQLGEAMAQDLAARSGIEFNHETSQADLLYKLQREIQLAPEIRTLFHTLRIEGISTMKPLVKDPTITLEQLVDELNNPVSFTTTGAVVGETHAHDVLAAISQKVMRVLRKAAHQAEKKPPVRDKLDQLEQHWGIAPDTLHQHLQKIGPKGAADFIQQHSQLLRQIAEVKQLIGSDYLPIISDHGDTLMVREQSYGEYNKPEDYLQSFNDFIRQQVNQSVALSVIVNRPKDLTRVQLKEVRMLLDDHHFTEAALQTAWRNKTNQDIAASIIGHIRRAALGEALMPFEQRVDQAMQRIYASGNWSQIQRRWLDRLAKQLTYEVVIDHQFVNQRFSTDGGAKKLNTMLGGQLDEVLDQFAQGLWPQTA